MERIVLRPPPTVDRADGGVGLTGALPVLGSLGSLGLVATMAAGSRQYAGVGLVVLATVLVAAAQVDRQRWQRARSADAARRDYLDHLAEVRHRLRVAADAQRAAALERHPAPGALAALVEAGAWHPADDLVVRYGVTELPLAAAPAAPEVAARADPFSVAAVRRLVTAHATCPGLPATLALDRVAGVAAPVATARAIVCSAVGRRDLTIAVLAADATRPRWDWVKWLPQATAPAAADAVGPRRLVSGSVAELLPLLPERGHLLLVVDGLPPPAPDRPVTVLRVTEAGPDTEPARVTADGDPLRGTADDCSVDVAEAFARRCAGTGVAPWPAEPDWSVRAPADRLRVPLGTADTGEEVLLDLKEAALGGVGPHGMVIGATGSGKSELLRSLVLRLALTHPPTDLHLVLVDFKGGAAFDGLAALPTCQRSSRTSPTSCRCSTAPPTPSPAS